MTRWRRLASNGISRACVTLALVASAGAAQEIRVGSEFQVNTYTQNDQLQAAVAVAGNGDFVIAWTSDLQDGNQRGVFARRFSSNGSALTGGLQANQFTSFNQERPSVAAVAGGDFVVVWGSSGQDGSSDGVFSRRFGSSGTALGVEVRVNATTSGYQNSPSVAASPSGAYVVAWTSAQNGDADIFAQRYSSAGSAVGGELAVNATTASGQRDSAVAVSATGDFIVVWTSYTNGSSDDVMGRRFSSAGTPLANEFRVNSYTDGVQERASVSVSASGDFVVVWEDGGQDGSYGGVFGRRFSSAGSPLGTGFQVNAYTMGFQSTPAVASKGDGDFIATWTSAQGGGSDDVWARLFSSTGAALSGEILVNTFVANPQSFPALALKSGRLVVAWASIDQDGGDNGIFAQRFAIPIPLDVDGDGEVNPLTDGVLKLRYEFGFRGDDLVSGAVNLGGCTRCAAAAIEVYLAGIAE